MNDLNWRILKVVEGAEEKTVKEFLPAPIRIFLNPGLELRKMSVPKANKLIHLEREREKKEKCDEKETCKKQTNSD